MFDEFLLNGLLGSYTKQDLDNYFNGGMISQNGYETALKKIQPQEELDANPATSSASGSVNSDFVQASNNNQNQQSSSSN